MGQSHMDRMTSFDASFLANERGAAHMTIGAVIVCEAPAPTFEDFLMHVRSRLHLLPRLRQRLEFPPLQMGRPLWVDDPHFDIANHVRRISLPEPGSDEQFRKLIGELLSPPLDRSRPLWQLNFVEGLEEGRFGVVYKTHHAMADGISAVDIAMLLFDVKPVSDPVREEADWTPQPSPSRSRVALESVRGLGMTVTRLAAWLRAAFRAPQRTLRRAGNSVAGVREVLMNLVRPAPKSSLNVKIGTSRDFNWFTCRLDVCKEIKNSLGGTVNDVVLAATSGALRRWMHERGESTEGIELQALVPVSIRAEDEHGQLGNKLTAMRGPLPVYEPDPVKCLRRISEAMTELKSSKQPYGAEAIWALNDWFRDFAPPLLLEPTARVNFSTRLFNLLVTNFPGPQIPFYILEGELTQIYPIGFLAQYHALAIAILSYNHRVYFGLLADPDRVGSLDPLPGYIQEAMDELAAAARAGGEAAAPAAG